MSNEQITAALGIAGYLAVLLLAHAICTAAKRGDEHVDRLRDERLNDE
jgi:hypothetical protein